MAQSYLLPAKYIIRPARVTDRIAIRMLAYKLSRWAIPASSHLQLIIQEIIFILAIAIPTTFITFLILEIAGIANGLTEIEIFIYRSIFWLALILPFLFEHFAVFHNNYAECFVVESNSYLVAYAILFHHHNLTVLQYLFVAPNFRKQKIGSQLIQSFIQKTDQPLFLWSRSNKIKFYIRLGFVPAKPLFLTEIGYKLKSFGVGYHLLM